MNEPRDYLAGVNGGGNVMAFFSGRRLQFLLVAISQNPPRQLSLTAAQNGPTTSSLRVYLTTFLQHLSTTSPWPMSDFGRRGIIIDHRGFTVTERADLVTELTGRFPGCVHAFDHDTNWVRTLPSRDISDMPDSDFVYLNLSDVRDYE